MRLIVFIGLFITFQCCASEYYNEFECKNGAFPTYEGNYHVGIINKNSTTYKDSCFTGVDNINCRGKNNLLKGDEVITAQGRNGFLCYWKGDNNVNWVRSDDVTIEKIVERKINNDNIIGRWFNGDNIVEISINDEGRYHITGKAYWHGWGDNLHIGELASQANIVNGAMHWDDFDGCSGKVKLLGNKIIIHDNYQCGGANVSFDGIYQH